MRIYPVFLQNAGCPHQCLFCDQKRSVSSPTLVSADDVASNLDQILPEYGDGEIAFYGGSFTMLAEAEQRVCLEVANQFVRRGRVQGIRLSTRPDALESPALKLLKAFDVSTVEIGCQSFDDQVLSQAKRGHTAEDNSRAVRASLESGFNVGIQLMPGLPGSSPAEALASVIEAIQLQPDFLRVYPAVVIEGTGMTELWRSGSYKPWGLDESVDVCADILSYCRTARVPVIRMGLQQDEQLEKNLLDGPYHPAFGQLVRSRLWRRALAVLPSEERNVSLNPVDFSDAIGHGGENRNWFAEQDKSFQFITDITVTSGSLRTAHREVKIQ